MIPVVPAVSIVCTSAIVVTLIVTLDELIFPRPFQHPNMTDHTLERKIDRCIADQIQIKNRVDKLDGHVIH